MGMLRELASHLIDSGVVSGSVTTSSFRVFASMVPDSCHIQDRVVGLLETPGFPPDARTDIDRPGLQILVRGDSISSVSTSYETAADKATEIMNTLHATTPGLLSGATSGNRYVGIWATQNPNFLQLDEKERPWLVCNYRIERSRT